MKRKVIYYTDEEKDEFSEIKWKEREFSYARFEKDYPFFHFILMRGMGIPVAKAYMRLFFNHRIIHAEKKPEAEEGFFIYGNHTNAIPDVMIPFLLFNRRRIHVIAGRGNCSIPVIGLLLPALGALPLPKGKKETCLFRNLMEKYLAKNRGIMIYPEAHIWPFYTGIRHFPEASMGYPARLCASCYVVTNVYRKRKFHRQPGMVTYVDGPILPDMELGLLKRKEKLRDEIYETMVKRSRENNVEPIVYIKKPNPEVGDKAEQERRSRGQREHRKERKGE